MAWSLAFALAFHLGYGLRSYYPQNAPGFSENGLLEFEEKAKLLSLLFTLHPTQVRWQLGNEQLRQRSLPSQMQLLGPDGQPFRKSAASPARKLVIPDDVSPKTQSSSSSFAGKSSGDSKSTGSTDGTVMSDGTPVAGSILEELPDFDPNYDPLAASRPKYDLAAASGRRDEAVWGAIAPESIDQIVSWSNHMRNAGITQLVGVFTESDVAARSPDGTPLGYMKALVDAGFDPNFVMLIDPSHAEARETLLKMSRDAFAEKRKLLIHCADGEKFTGLVMADWLLTDYIGGDNYLEAVETLRARKRLSGVGRVVAEDALEAWIQNGHV